MTELTQIRRDLARVLGYNYPVYIRSMAEWLAGKNARNDLELDLPFITTGVCRELHNQFLKGILHRAMQPDLVDMLACMDMDSIGYYDYDTLGPEFTGHFDLLQSNTGNSITLHSAPPPSQLPMRLSVAGPQLRVDTDMPEMDPTSLEFDDGGGEVCFEGDLVEPPPKRDLYYVEMTRFPEDDYEVKMDDDEEKSESGPDTKYDDRFPVSFIQELTRLDHPRNSLEQFVVSNEADRANLQKWTQHDPRLVKFFPLKPETEQPLHPTNTSVQGRFLLKAWAKGMKNVHPDAVSFAVRATRDHIKTIIAALIKKRKAYEWHNGTAVRIGQPYPNKYLRSGPHRVNVKSQPFTSRLVEPVQIPQLVESAEEHERLGIMRYATSLNTQPRYQSKIGCTELLTLIQSDSRLIPSNQARNKLVEKLFLHAKGIMESAIVVSLAEEIDVEEEEGQLQPLCSY